MIIAEIGTSHSGNLEKAKKLIEESASTGCDAVKFQWVYADEILHKKTGFVNLPTGKIPLYQRFKELEVAPKFFMECKRICDENNVKFICSPFGLKSLNELLRLNPYAVKIASPELNHFPLLKALADYRKSQKEKGENPIPVILSSGVSKESDIEGAFEILGKENVSLLHCVTSYPAPEEDYNLAVLETLKNKFNVETGVSDHSLNPVLVPVLSVAFGGTIIEKHITLSKETDGLDDPVALTIEDFSYMCHCVHQSEACRRQYPDFKEKIIFQMEDSFGKEKVFKTIGNGIKKLAESEEKNYGRTNRSLHLLRDMKKGETISESDIGVLRTEKILSVGEHPKFLKDFVGKKLNRDVFDGDGLVFEMI